MSSPYIPPPVTPAVWPPSPSGMPAPQNQNNDIRQFEPLNDFAILGLLIITLGLYAPFWMIRTAKVSNRLSPIHTLNFAAIWTLLALQIANIVIGFVVGAAGVADPKLFVTLSGFSRLFSWGVAIYYLFLAFRIRGALNDIIARTSPELRPLSWLGTFFFGVLYLQIYLNQRTKQLNALLAGMR